MMNVNFFEKKQVNLLPYIVGGFFVLGLLLMGVYFYLARANYETTISEKNLWLSEHAEEVVLARRISRLDGLASESAVVQETLKEAQYPMYKLTTDLASAVPDETDRLVSFYITDPAQATFILENTQPTQAQAIVEELEEKVYVDGVQFLHAENLNPEENAMRFELIVDLNSENFPEEAAE